MSAVLSAEKLSVGYGGIAVVKDIDIEIRPGQVVALVGPNGAGKSTTLMCLSGQLSPLSGCVMWDGVELKLPAHRRARRGLSFVGEDRSVFMGLTVEENLRVGRVDIDDVLRLFPELTNRRRTKAGALSGGEQQMLTVARALCRRPSVLLADELSLGLAPLVTERLLTAIRDAARANDLAVLLVEQHIRNVVRFADWVYVMRQGSIDLQCRGDELEGRMLELTQSYLGASVVASEDPGGGS